MKFLTVAAVLLVAAGCATLTERRVQRLDELAGAWEGSVSTPVGTQPATLVVRPDGAYAGTSGGVTIQGRFGVTGAGLRFETDDGITGTGRVLEKDGQLILRTRRDDGSVTSEFRKAK